jgi:hypothetical protein
LVPTDQFHRLLIKQLYEGLLKAYIIVPYPFGSSLSLFLSCISVTATLMDYVICEEITAEFTENENHKSGISTPEGHSLIYFSTLSIPQ